VPAVHCDASSTDEERKAAKKGLEDGSIRVLCNVDIFSVGWDCPIVSCVILARPTWSLIWYLQAIGRGLRSYPGKRDCIVLDNAGNVFRHGTPYRPREISLEKPDRRKSKLKPDITVRQCEECMSVFETPADCCPYCGWTLPKREIKLADGVLREYKETEEEKKARKIKEAQSQFYKLQWVARKKNLPQQWIKNEIVKKYGNEVVPYIEPLFRIKAR
jgi:superfamily II DNA or RNA helicase